MVTENHIYFGLYLKRYLWSNTTHVFSNPSESSGVNLIMRASNDKKFFSLQFNFTGQINYEMLLFLIFNIGHIFVKLEQISPKLVRTSLSGLADRIIILPTKSIVRLENLTAYQNIYLCEKFDSFQIVRLCRKSSLGCYFFN